MSSSLPRSYRIARHVLLGLIAVILFALLFGWVTMTAWNAVIPAVVALPALSYWQAVALLVLARILTGRFSHPHHGPRFRRRHGHDDSAALYSSWWESEGEAAFQRYAARQMDGRP